MTDSPGKRAVANEQRNYVILWTCAILLVSPIDLVPFLPIDDVFYVIFGLRAGRSILLARRFRRVYREYEEALVRRMAGLQPRDARQAQLMLDLEEDEQEEQIHGRS